MKKKAIVIGAGIAGIAVAIRLKNLGLEVSVFENNTYPGGKLSEITFDGYRFDAGPSLFTLPELVEELFSDSAEEIKKYFEYTRLEEVCRYFYEDGTSFIAPSDTILFAREASQTFSVEEKQIKSHLEASKRMYELTEKLFLQSSLHSLRSYLNKTAFKALLNLPKLKTSKVMHEINSKTFTDPRLTQLFDRYATYNGSNPYKAPATLNIIPHLEYNMGAYFPKKGMHSITESLVRLAEQKGITFLYNQKVTEIIVENRKATGIKTNSDIFKADAVISNADITSTYKYLLKQQKHPEKILAQEKSSSAIVFYWGINKQFPKLGLHNILFAKNYEKEFNCIFDRKTLYEDPTVYINITSKIKPDDAPAGHENWFVMINVPPNSGQDWNLFITESKKYILKKISRILKQDIAPYIVAEKILDPIRIETRTGSLQGALYGNSSNNKFSAFLRHPNFSGPISNLFFCGGSVHPGGGIPLCLFSAKIVAELVQRKLLKPKN